MTPADVCAACTATGCLCVLEAVEWPPRDREAIAVAEAQGEPYRGAGAARPVAAVEASAARYARYREAMANRARFGPGGLFDEM